jgi:hypothetical protein
MLVDLVEGAAQQVARFQVDLVDRVFQRGDGVGQVGDCASRKVLRSRAAVSSSSAARLTAPSAAISRLMRSISPCRP